MREKRDGRLDQFCLSGSSGLSGLSGLSRLFGLSGLSSKILDATKDNSAHLVVCLQIPSRRSLLQQGEDATGTVSTQYGLAVRRKVRAGLAGDAGFYTNSSRLLVQAEV